MKAFTQIEQQITSLYQKLEQTKMDHGELTNFEMLSSQGVRIREELHKILGEITGLEWVINDQINGDL